MTLDLIAKIVHQRPTPVVARKVAALSAQEGRETGLVGKECLELGGIFSYFSTNTIVNNSSKTTL